MQPLKLIRRSLKWAGIGCLALLVMIVVVFVLLQTRFAKDQLSSRLSSLLSSQLEQKITLGKIEGFIPFNIRLKQFSMSDEQGPWLLVDDLLFKWNPAALFKGKLLIETVGASKIALERLPSIPKEKEKPKKEEKGYTPPELPATLPPVFVENIYVSELLLGDAVLGESAVFKIDGSIGQPPPESERGLQAVLKLVRVGAGPKTSAFFEIGLHGDPLKLKVSARFEESAGGWVAKVAKLQETGGLGFSLEGDGPLSSWQGKFAAETEKFGSVETTFSLAMHETIEIALSGKCVLSGSLLPHNLQPVVGHEISFGADAALQPSRLFNIRKIFIHGKGIDLGGRGVLETEDQRFQAELRLTVGDMAVLNDLTGTDLSGRLALSAHFSGLVREPAGSLILTVDDFAAQDVKIQKIRTTIDIKPKGPVSPNFSGIHVAGRGRAENISGEKDVQLPENALKWSLDGDVTKDLTLSLTNFEIDGEKHHVVLMGTYNPTTAAGKVDVLIRIDDLGLLTALTGKAFPGAVEVKASAAGEGHGRNASAQIEAHFRPAQGFPPEIGSCIGPQLDLVTRAELKNGSQVKIASFNLKSPVFELTAAATANLLEKRVGGNWNLSVPSLQPLAPLVGKPLAGRLTAEGQVGGSFHSMEATASVTGRDILFDKLPLKKVLLDLNSQDLPEAPRGNLSLALVKKNEALKLSTDFTLKGQILGLSSFLLTAPGARIRGNVQVDLAESLIEGDLDGNVRDLSLLGNFLQEPMNGSATLQAKFSPEKKNQNVKLHIEGKSLRVPSLEIDGISLSADLRNIFNSPHGRATAAVSGFVSPGLKVARLSVTVKGDQKGLKFQTDVEGESVAPFELQSHGEISLSDKSQRLQIGRLTGKFGDYAILLKKSLFVSKSGKTLELKSLDLGFGDGRIQASGLLNTREFRVDAQLQNLPLSASVLFGGPSLKGTLSGAISTNGTPAQPEIDVELNLKNVKLAEASLSDIPPVDLNAKATLSASRLNLHASLEGLSQKPARAELTFPVEFAVEPFVFTVPENGKLAGRLEMDADLAKLTKLVPLDGQDVAGEASVDLALRGELKFPEVDGTIRLKNGSYENYLSGTILKNLNVEIVAKGRSFDIVRLDAGDGGDGRIEAKGSIDVDPAKNFPLDVQVDFVNATLVRRYEVTGAVQGNLSVSGSLADMSVKGDLKVGPAEINLPERLPPEITALDVVEINGNENIPPAQKTQDRGSPLKVSLDVQINLPKRVFVRGWGLDSEWEGRLRLAGTSDQPQVIGHLSSVRGKMNFLNKRFDITRGTIRFYGATPPAPTLDIIAESKAKEMTAILKLNGPASDPKLQLESDPPLPQDEVLARLLFGRSATDITPSQALTLALAVKSLATGGGGGPGFMAKIRNLLGVDELEFRSAGEGTEEGTVGIGKYLTEGVYVDLQKGIGGGKDKVSIEVEVTDHISIESQISSDRSSGLGINYNYRY